MVKIRKAMKRDLESYILLRKSSLKDYSSIVGKKLTITKKQIQKEFYDILKNKKRFLFLIEESGNVVGFLIGNTFISAYNDIGYIDDLFILRNYRRKGFASKLINKFIKILKKKKIKLIRLGVNPKNKIAIKLYNKIGFKIKHYELDKII